MNTKSTGKIVLALAALFTISSLAPPTASAQGGKIRSTAERRMQPGGGFWANQRTSRNIQHARDYSRSIARYTTQSPSINPEITQSESRILGMQLQSIQRDMGIIRKFHDDDPQVVKQVKVIENKLAKASETQEVLHAECCKDAPEGKVCGDMAAKLTTTLDEIAKEHAKLVEMTGNNRREGHEEATVGNVEGGE